MYLNLNRENMKVTLRTQLAAFENGSILDSDGSVDSNCFNFYDWFCRDSSLKNKSVKLFIQLRTFLKNNPDIDLDTHYVFFKNNCPGRGSLYDDFRICNEDHVVFNVTAKSGHSGKAEIWGRSNDFKEPIKVANSFSKLF